MAARNLQGRFEAGDYTQKILKSVDELGVYGFGRDVNLRAVVDDAACGSCSCVGRNGQRSKVHIEHDLDAVRTSLPARLDIVDGRLPNAERDEWPSGQRNEVGFPGEDHSRGQRQADGVFAFDEDALAEFAALEPELAQPTSVIDVPFRAVSERSRPCLTRGRESTRFPPVPYAS